MNFIVTLVISWVLMSLRSANALVMRESLQARCEVRMSGRIERAKHMTKSRARDAILTPWILE